MGGGSRGRGSGVFPKSCPHVDLGRWWQAEPNQPGLFGPGAHATRVRSTSTTPWPVGRRGARRSSAQSFPLSTLLDLTLKCEAELSSLTSFNTKKTEEEGEKGLLRAFQFLVLGIIVSVSKGHGEGDQWTLTDVLMLRVMVYLTGLELGLQVTRRDSESNLRKIQNLSQQIFVEQSFPNRQDFIFSMRLHVPRA